MNGFTDADTSLLMRSVSPSVVKYGYWRGSAGGGYEGSAMTYEDMRRWTARARMPSPPREVQVYHVLDQTASGFVRAWWGTDYILLARENGRWMIRMILWQSPPPTP